MRPLLLPLLAACSAAPRSGTWTYETTEVVENGCQLDEALLTPDGTFQLRADGATLTIDDSAQVFTCEVTGAGYRCPSRFSQTVDLGVATVDVAVSVEGRFRSPLRGEGTQTLTGTCEGAACALSAALGVSFPCTSDVAFEIAWLSDALGDLAN